MAYSTTKKERNGFVTVRLLPGWDARFFFICKNLFVDKKSACYNKLIDIYNQK